MEHNSTINDIMQFYQDNKIKLREINENKVSELLDMLESYTKSVNIGLSKDMVKSLSKDMVKSITDDLYSFFDKFNDINTYKDIFKDYKNYISIIPRAYTVFYNVDCEDYDFPISTIIESINNLYVSIGKYSNTNDHIKILSGIYKMFVNLNNHNHGYTDIETDEAHWINNKYLSVYSCGRVHNQYIFEHSVQADCYSRENTDNDKFSLVFSSLANVNRISSSISDLYSDNIIFNLYSDKITCYEELKKYVCDELKIGVYHLDKNEFINNWKDYEYEKYEFKVTNKMMHFTYKELLEFLFEKLDN